MVSTTQHAGFRPHVASLDNFPNSLLPLLFRHVTFCGLVSNRNFPRTLSSLIPLELWCNTSGVQQIYQCCLSLLLQLLINLLQLKTLCLLCDFCQHFEHVTLDMTIYHCNNLAVTISYTILRLKYGMCSCK